MLKIGFSITKNPKGATLSQSIENYFKCGMTAFQVFMTPPDNGLDGKRLSAAENNKIKELLIKSDIYGVVHGKYIYNFSRQDCSVQVDQLVQEMTLANDIGCDLILHQGKNMPEENLTRLEALHNYVRHISEALEKSLELNNGILLENSAKQGNELGYSLEELVYIYNQFDDNLKPRVGFCLDLCHIFVAGELDLRKVDQVELFFAKFDSLIGLNKLKCIHFNDSTIPFAGCNDSHGDIYCGYISNPLLGGSVEGFRRVSQIAQKNKIAIIFETPCAFNSMHTGSQLMWQLKMVKGWAQNNETVYLSYISTHPHLSQLAQEYYTKSKKKKPKKLKNEISKEEKSKEENESICSCQLNVSHLETPKIKLKLKSQP